MDDIPAFDELLHAVRAGDKRAQCEVFLRYYPRVLGLLQNRWGVASRTGYAARDEEDVAQSAIKSLIHRLEKGEFEIADERSLRNVLFRIAMNKAASTDRRESAVAAASFQATGGADPAAPLEQLYNDAVDREERAFVESVADKVVRLLGILNERQRTIALALMQEDADVRKQMLAGLKISPATISREKRQIARLWLELED